jgi:GGDEF domain-containing protein
VKLLELLDKEEDPILAEASESLRRCHLAHYETAGFGTGQERLQALYRLAARCVRERDLSPVIGYADRVAQERFAAGYDPREVQTAFNVLEESIWKHIIAGLPPELLAESIGLISTVHGAGKDQLARTYVELASHRRPATMDLAALFKGTGGG